MKKPLVLLSLLSLCSCATPGFSVRVNALAGPRALEPRDFVVEPAQEGEQDLQWLEYRALVERTLVAEGWRPAADRDGADLVVLVDYGISDPQEVEYQVQRPVYGQTGQTTTYQTTYDPGSGYGTQAVSTPQFGVQYYDTSTQTGIVYQRHLVLTAIGRAPDGGDQQLWQVQARSSGWSGDLRQVFPVMLAAARPHLGHSTGREIEVSLKESSSEVRAITGAD